MYGSLLRKKVKSMRTSLNIKKIVIPLFVIGMLKVFQIWNREVFWRRVQNNFFNKILAKLI